MLEHQFAIKGNKTDGYYLLDRATFNNWGEKRRDDRFPTREAADAYAWRCYEFKTGRRMNI